MKELFATALNRRDPSCWAVWYSGGIQLSAGKKKRQLSPHSFGTL
jgi:hypothetical protein